MRKLYKDALICYLMDVSAVSASIIASVVAVLITYKREELQVIMKGFFHILKHCTGNDSGGQWLFCTLCPFLMYPLLKRADIPPGSVGFLICSVLATVTLATSIPGYKLFARKEREEREVREEGEMIIARCGALCSECPYFADGSCPSCPEGPASVRESCPIFECASKEKTACHLCSDLMRCRIFSQERQNCPFEKEFFPLRLGTGYVIYEKNAEESIGIFKDYLNRGEFGLLVSRRFPQQIKEKYNLKNIASIWLSTSEGEDTWIDPCNLSRLHHVITDFIRNRPMSFVLFEGFEYIMIRNSFYTALRFVQSIMDEITLRRSHLLLSINPDAFEKRELALIRRELTEL